MKLSGLDRFEKGCFVLKAHQSANGLPVFKDKEVGNTPDPQPDGQIRLLIHINRFPGYAPELNPNEFVWSQLKRSVANSAPRDIYHLRSLLRAPVRRFRHSQKLLRSCLHASGLPWK